jgi:hypothetical protein
MAPKLHRKGLLIFLNLNIFEYFLLKSFAFVLFCKNGIDTNSWFELFSWV